MTTIYIVLPLLFLTMLIGIVYWEIRRKRMHTKARIKAWRERGVPAKTEVAMDMAQASEPATETRFGPDKQRVFLLPARSGDSSPMKVEEAQPDARRRYRA